MLKQEAVEIITECIGRDRIYYPDSIFIEETKTVEAIVFTANLMFFADNKQIPLGKFRFALKLQKGSYWELTLNGEPVSFFDKLKDAIIYLRLIGVL